MLSGEQSKKRIPSGLMTALFESTLGGLAWLFAGCITCSIEWYGVAWQGVRKSTLVNILPFFRAISDVSLARKLTTSTAPRWCTRETNAATARFSIQLQVRAATNVPRQACHDGLEFDDLGGDSVADLGESSSGEMAVAASILSSA
jgi:hypothetical protein